jgi:hypothetical protein
MAFDQVQLQLTEEQSRGIEEVAQRENISMAEVIRRAVDYWLKLKNELSIEEHWQRTSRVVDRFHRGQSDISEPHNEYFVETYAEDMSHLDIEKRKRAFDVVRDLDGKYHSGLFDVSEKHDDYLAETYGTWKSS